MPYIQPQTLITINLNLMEINLIPIKFAEQQHDCQQLCDTAHLASSLTAQLALLYQQCLLSTLKPL